MKLLNYTTIFEPLAEGGYMAVIPSLPGVVTFGEDLAEAREMAIDAIRCHCEGLLKDGEPLPKDTPIKLDPMKDIVSVTIEAA